MQFVWIVLMLLTIFAAFQDIINMEIPAYVLIASGVISIAFAVYEILTGSAVVGEVFLSLIPGAAMMLLSFLSRQSIGYGDGLMVLALSPAFGLGRICMGLSIAFFISGIAAASLMICKKGGRKQHMPFIPYLAVGLGVMIFAQI